MLISLEGYRSFLNYFIKVLCFFHNYFSFISLYPRGVYIVCIDLPMIRENKADITSGLDMWRSHRNYLLFASFYLYCTVLHCTVLYCIVLHCIALYCIVLQFAILYCIALYPLLVLSAFSLILCTGRWLAHHTSHQEHVKLSKHSVVGTIKPVTVGQQPLPSKVAI